jgi:hypothetical protein
MWSRFKAAQLAGNVPVTHGGVVGQAWRGRGARQALLVKALNGIDVRALDDEAGRAAGKLLGLCAASDVIDAALVLLAEDGDDIITSDLDDIEPLSAASGLHVELIRV